LTDQPRPLQLRHLRHSERIEKSRIILFLDYLDSPAERRARDAHGRTMHVRSRVALTEMFRKHKQCLRDQCLQCHVAKPSA